MQEITIGKKTYPLHYGIDFIREMDKRHAISSGGIEFGAGMQAVLYYFEQFNPVILVDVILSATHTLKSIPSVSDIEQWLGEQEDIEKVFADFLKALETAPLTKIQLTQMRRNIQKTLTE